MKYLSKIMKISFILTLMICLLLACSEKQPSVKPEKNHSEKRSTNVNGEKDTRSYDSVAASTSEEYLAAKKKHQRFLTHICLIEISCELYHDAYDKLPDDLSGLFDGFLFLWPGNIYGEGPVKVLKTSPNPDNPEHRGKVHYWRLGSHEGYLEFIVPDKGVG